MSQLIVQLRHAKRNQATTLDLTNRLLTFLPKEIYSLQHLNCLNLSHNKIAHLQPNIKQLQQLQQLYLNSNQLTDLPKQILELYNLTTLQVKDNPLAQQFKILLTLKPHDSLKDVLKSCFKSSVNSLAHTPSWLTESHSKNAFKIQHLRDIKYQSTTPKQYQPQRRISIKPKSISKKEQQPEKQSLMGTISLQVSEIIQQKQFLTTDFRVLSHGYYCGLAVTVKKSFAKQKPQYEFENQVTILSRYRHPFIVLLLGVVPSPHCWVITQQLQSSLLELIRKGIDEQERSQIVHQLLLGLSYLHSHGIVHRNICAESVFLDVRNHVKLTDFDGAIYQSQQGYSKPYKTHLPNQYVAPELQQTAYSIPSDMFALGTLLYQLYFGQIPRQYFESQQLKAKKSRQGQLPCHMGVKRQIQQLINRCRSPQVRDRPDCSFLLKFKQW